MKLTGKVLIAVGAVALQGSLLAVIPDKFQTIVDRNAFGLNPPPLQSTNAPEILPPVKVNLTGFATVAGQKRAYFVIPAKDPKDNQYLYLGEGQREGILEVVKISEEEGEVRVKNSGIDTVLSLKANNMIPAPKLGPGVTPVNAPMGVPGAAPMAAQSSPVFNPATAANVIANSPATPAVANQPPPAVPSGGMPQPGYNAQPAQGTTQPASDLRQIPTRTLRLPTTSGTPQSSYAPQNSVVYNPGAMVASANGGTPRLPSLNTGNGAAGNGFQSPSVVYNPGSVAGTSVKTDPAVQMAGILINEAGGGPPAPPFPPPGWKGTVK